MKVVISVPGKFHAFHTARQLEDRSALRKIFTSYPRSKVDLGNVDSKLVHSLWPVEAISILRRYLPLTHLPYITEHHLVHLRNDSFDRLVAKRLPKVKDGVFIGYAGACNYSINKAEELGYTTVVERASSHIRTQAKILAGAYKEEGRNPPIFKSNIDSHSRRNEKEYNKADYILTPSEFVYNSFRRNGIPDEKLLFIPFGVDTHSIRPNTTQEKNRPIRFLFIGSVGIRKGAHILLRAWDKLPLNNAELIIAGNIKNEKSIEEYRGNESVKILGWTDKLSDWRQNSDVFVFPTLEEGSAIVTYEAMAAGLPLITTAHSGWVGNDGTHGLEIPINDVQSLADAIKYMYDNESERKRMGCNARELMQSSYTWNDYGERIHETLCTLV